MTKRPLKRKKTEKSFDSFDLEDEMDQFFDEYASRMEEEIAGFLSEAMESKGHATGFVYGFRMTSGSDGKPVVEEYGNVIGRTDSRKEGDGTKIDAAPAAENEPLTDVIDNGKEVMVLAELPGVQKEDIQIDVREDVVLLKVDTETRKYDKRIKLPCRVSKENMRTTHKNGILEIIISKSI